MLKFFKKIKIQIKIINNIYNLTKLQYIYKKCLNKKNGYFKKIIKIFNKLPKHKKPNIGLKINTLKNKFLNLINKQKKKISQINKKNIINLNILDINLPSNKNILYANLHPITITINTVENFFNKLGFKSINSKEIENTLYNFNYLNIKKNHPSRTDKDTFWINKNLLLKTQTSSIQIRCMKKYKPPLKIISPGCVFRKDDDSNHTPMFHQIEVFLVDKNINLSNLIYIIKKFLYYFFEKKIKYKIIPTYFPFTEPSFEIYIKNKKNKWIEIIGAGLIHPNIFKNVNINNKEFTGFALGIGIERLTMIKYNIINIKNLYKNNLKFLNQF